MKSSILKFAFVGLATVASTSVFAGACTTDGSGNVTNTSGACTLAASSFGVTLYEIGLCTSTPTVPTAGTAYVTSNCQVIYSNPTGAAVSAGVAQNLTGGTSRIPQPGTYNYGYAVFKNQITMQGSASFASTVYSTATSPTSGTSCVTTATSVNVSGISSSMTPLPYSCASGATAGAVTVTVDTLPSIPGSSGFYANHHYTATDQTANASALGGDTLDVYLMNTSNQLATTPNTVSQMMGVQNLATPVVINSSSTSLDVGFPKSTALSLTVTPPSSTHPVTTVFLAPAIPVVKISGH